MTKWIRWWGLGTFVVLTAIIGVLWIFFVDGWVKRLIEDVGTEAVGARVELGHADLSLFPAGLKLTRLQVTNPKNPMTNAVEVANIALGLDGLNLLQRKVIIEEMTVDGVRLGTPRTTSGATKPTTDVVQEEEGSFSISLPSFEVPDVQTILKNEDLETVRLIESLKSEIQQEKETWKSRLKELPGKAQIAKYKARIKQLKSATKGGLKGMLRGAGEVQAIKEDIERDVAALKNAEKEFKEKLALLQTRFDQLQKAPQRDIQHLKTKYNVSPQGLANMSQTLLGSHIGSWVHQGAEWYERAQPFLEEASALGGGESGPEVRKPLRGKGLDVHFREAHPLPDFLVRLANVRVNLDFGDLAGTVHHITSDQPTLGKPLTFAFNGERLEGVKTVALEGMLNHILPGDTQDHIMLRAKGYELADLTLSKNAKWPVTLSKGLGEITVDVKLKGEALHAQGSGNLHALQLVAGRPDDTNPLTQALSSAVSEISELSLQMDMTGTLDDYDVQVSSDLDRILQNAAGKMVKKLAARFGADLQAAISAKITEPMKELQASLGGFKGIVGDLTNRLGQHNDVLKSVLEKNLPSKTFKNLPGGFKLPF
ncbi:MAG: TIGR03545 family protein [Nitrospirales bacterium]